MAASNARKERARLRPFEVRDCALVAQATGRRAQNLRELREGLSYVTSASIYYHFWGRLLRPVFDEPEYNNDFAAWSYHALHDKILAERLSAIYPVAFDDLEALRQEILDIVETRLDESELIPWAQADQQFHFIRAATVVFDTELRAQRPEDMPSLLPKLSSGSIFYHLIDAQRRNAENEDDFSIWLSAFGGEYESLRQEIDAIDPWFSPLPQLREQLTGVFRGFFGGGV
jgi:hypothetical protein